MVGCLRLGRWFGMGLEEGSVLPRVLRPCVLWVSLFVFEEEEAGGGMFERSIPLGDRKSVV